MPLNNFINLKFEIDDQTCTIRRRTHETAANYCQQELFTRKRDSEIKQNLNRRATCNASSSGGSSESKNAKEWQRMFSFSFWQWNWRRMAKKREIKFLRIWQINC